MAITFTIAGVAKSIKPNWRISEQINGRNVMRFQLDSPDGSYRPAARAVVAFADGATTLYGGHIHDQDERGFGGAPLAGITNGAAAIDFNALPDRRQAAITIPAVDTLKDGLIQLQELLDGYGVTLHGSQADGPTFADDVILDYGSLTDHLNKLSVMTGWAWEIGYDLKLRMFEPGDVAAPWNIAEDDGHVIGDITVRPTLSGYANYITVRFTNAAVAAYAILKATVNWSDGQVVEIGGRTYTFKATLASANDVKLGASVSESLDTLHRAITLAPTAGTDYHDGTTVNGEVTAYRTSDALVVTALQAGASGNGIGVSTDNPDATWTVAGGATVSSLLFGTDASLTASVFATSGAAPADRVDRTYDHPEITDEATAQLMANGYLARDLVTPKEIKYRTHTAGIHPGQIQVINESRRNISGNCLITAVDISSNGSVYIYDVTAVEGLVIPEAPHELFKLWSKGGGASTSGGSLAIVGGGSGGGTSVSFFAPLGGSENDAVVMASPTPAAVDVPHCLPFFARSSFTALVRAWVWNRDAAAQARPELWNQTDNVLVAEGAFSGATSRPVTPQEINAAIVAGKEYRLKVKGDTAGMDVWGIGTLEAA